MTQYDHNKCTEPRECVRYDMTGDPDNDIKAAMSLRGRMKRSVALFRDGVRSIIISYNRAWVYCGKCPCCGEPQYCTDCYENEDE